MSTATHAPPPLRRKKAYRFSSHSRGYPRVLPSTGATPPDPRRRLAVAQMFFFYRWSQGAGPSNLSRNTDKSVCIVDLQLRKGWTANDRVSTRIYQYRALPDLALWLQHTFYGESVEMAV